MEIKNIKLQDVKVAEYNPRSISPDERNKLKQSLKEFGCVRPLVINKRTGLLVSGHQTLDVAKELNLIELPSIEVDVDEKKEKILNIGLNKISGEWDYNKLNDLLEEVRDTDVFECSGFDVSDIDLMEKLNDDGSAVSDVPAEQIKDPIYEIVFQFDSEKGMLDVKRFFSCGKHGWKDKSKLNTNLLTKIIEDANGKNQ